MADKKPSETFKEILFKERDTSTSFAAFLGGCSNICGKSGLNRGYRLYKLLQLREKRNDRTPEKEERDIKESELITN